MARKNAVLHAEILYKKGNRFSGKTKGILRREKASNKNKDGSSFKARRFSRHSSSCLSWGLG